MAEQPRVHRTLRAWLRNRLCTIAQEPRLGGRGSLRQRAGQRDLRPAGRARSVIRLQTWASRTSAEQARHEFRAKVPSRYSKSHSPKRRKTVTNPTRADRRGIPMIIPCISCGHKLWSVDREIHGRLIQVHFDREDTSETYAEQVTLCPGCGRFLISRQNWRGDARGDS